MLRTSFICTLDTIRNVLLRVIITVLVNWGLLHPIAGGGWIGISRYVSVAGGDALNSTLLIPTIIPHRILIPK